MTLHPQFISDIPKETYRIVLPDGSAVKLVAGTDGRAYFQIPVND